MRSRTRGRGGAACRYVSSPMDPVVHLESAASPQAWLAFCQAVGSDGQLDGAALEQARDTLSAWPWEAVRQAPPEWLAAAAAGRPCPALDLCTSVLLTGRDDPTKLAALFAQDWVKGLVGVDFQGVRVPHEALEPLVRNARGLRMLFASQCEIGDAHVAAIVAHAPESLVALGLQGNRVSDAGALRLTEASFPALTTLVLGMNALGPGGARALLGATNLPQLQQLGVHAQRTQTATLSWGKALADVAIMPSLVGLDLGFNGIGANGLKALAANSSAARLQILSLRHSKLGPKSGALLTDRSVLPGLIELKLDGNKLGADVAKSIYEARPDVNIEFDERDRFQVDPAAALMNQFQGLMQLLARRG